MKNKLLHELNFKRLLGYPDNFQPQFIFDVPIHCDRFCIECEESGTAKAGGLTLISLGCDTDDFERILGPRISTQKAVEFPIMFLLLDPGEDWKQAEEVCFKGFKKMRNHFGVDRLPGMGAQTGASE
jgi:hypothetical protein